nr:MAG TPA: hypothetical protein [Caudoviricetes sp.]
MKQGILTYSTERPQNLSLRKLYGDIYELFATEDIEETTAPDPAADDADHVTQYKYALFADTRKLSGYEAAVSAFIGLKYTTGDELALMRKGFANPADPEYTTYIEYVEACKNYARRAFGITV